MHSLKLLFNIVFGYSMRITQEMQQNSNQSTFGKL